MIDTHAGGGLYDLAGAEASRTGEWRDGIGRLLGAELRAGRARAARALSRRGRGVQSGAADGALKVYPGSPALVRHWLRAQDRLIACEAEPGAARALSSRMRGDNRVKAVAIDGWTALNAYVPPKERRGLVLIDPPFEQPDEFARLEQALAAAHRKWPTGIFLLWYPLKDARGTEAFGRRLSRLGIAAHAARRARPLRRRATAPKLAGSGLIVVNPPWTLPDELAVLLPALAPVLRRRRPAAPGSTGLPADERGAARPPLSSAARLMST